MTVWHRRVLAGGVLALGLSLAVGTAFADGRTAFLIEHLRADDFRVRTNAALALGATNDDSVIEPLCSALNDSSDVVRQAVAAALKRLNRASSLSCLRNRVANETNASVRLQVTRAIEAIEASASDTPPTRIAPNARFYVALSSVTNNTGRSQADIDRVVLGAIRSKLESLGSYQLAPANESADAARSAISKRRLKAYYLSVLAEKFDYSDGNLRVRVKVAVFTYPSKDLRGEVPAGLTQTGVRPGDRSAEENLLSMAAGRAADLFAQNFQ